MGTRALEMFGRTVRQLRKQGHLSQEALAEAAHLNRSYLSEIENGLVAPSLLIVLRLARALDVPLAKLLEDFTPSAVKRMKL